MTTYVYNAELSVVGNGDQYLIFNNGDHYIAIYKDTAGPTVEMSSRTSASVTYLVDDIGYDRGPPRTVKLTFTERQEVFLSLANAPPEVQEESGFTEWLMPYRYPANKTELRL